MCIYICICIYIYICVYICIYIYANQYNIVDPHEKVKRHLSISMICSARVQTWQQTVRMWSPPGALLRPADWKIFRQSLNGETIK